MWVYVICSHISIVWWFLASGVGMAYSVPFPSVRFTRSFSFVSVLFFSLKLSVFGTGQAERPVFLIRSFTKRN